MPYDIMALFAELRNGDLPLYKLNFRVITLLPKKENAVQIQQYRPICLLNVSFKNFTKVATNRITDLAHKVVRPSQTAFMPGRHILEGVVVLHETIHEMPLKTTLPSSPDLPNLGNVPLVSSLLCRPF